MLALPEKLHKTFIGKTDSDWYIFTLGYMLCPNRMLGLGPLLEDEKAKEISAQWGNDAVHPLPVAYKIMATAIENDVSDTGARYINPPKQQGGPTAKKQRIDHSKLRQGWVDGCSAVLPRRDTTSGSSSSQGTTSRGRNRGRGRGSTCPYWGKSGTTSTGGRGWTRGRSWRGK
jgi:hypothetical protein